MITSQTIPNYKPADTTEKTAAYKLFHYRFLCEVAQMHLYEAKWLDQGGFITTGDPNLDRQMAVQPVVVQLTPAAMARFHDEGVEMRLVTPEDSVKIYQIIYDHLRDWETAVNFNVNLVNGPVDELKMFDRLAAEVYKLARFYWKGEAYHGRFQQFNQRRGGRRQFLEGASVPTVDNKPDHTPMSDAIVQGLGNRHRPWKGS